MVSVKLLVLILSLWRFATVCDSRSSLRRAGYDRVFTSGYYRLVTNLSTLLNRPNTLVFCRFWLLVIFLMRHASQILLISWKAASAMLLIPGLEFHLFCQFEAGETFKFYVYDASSRHHTSDWMATVQKRIRLSARFHSTCNEMQFDKPAVFEWNWLRNWVHLNFIICSYIDKPGHCWYSGM